MLIDVICVNAGGLPLPAGDAQGEGQLLRLGSHDRRARSDKWIQGFMITRSVGFQSAYNRNAFSSFGRNRNRDFKKSQKPNRNRNFAEIEYSVISAETEYFRPEIGITVAEI